MDIETPTQTLNCLKCLNEPGLEGAYAIAQRADAAEAAFHGL